VWSLIARPVIPNYNVRPAIPNYNGGYSHPSHPLPQGQRGVFPHPKSQHRFQNGRQGASSNGSTSKQGANSNGATSNQEASFNGATSKQGASSNGATSTVPAKARQGPQQQAWRPKAPNPIA